MYTHVFQEKTPVLLSKKKVKGDGDKMPPEWRLMTCVEVWRGMQKDEKRPAIDIKKVRKMLEKRNYCPEKRFNDDREATNGVPKCLLNEYKQKYMDILFKHDSESPTAYCRLCKNEA